MATNYAVLIGGFDSDPTQAARDAFIAARLVVLDHNYTDPNPLLNGYTTIVTAWTAVAGAFQDAISSPPAGSFGFFNGVNFNAFFYAAPPPVPPYTITPGGDPASYDGLVYAVLSNAPAPPAPVNVLPIGNPGTQFNVGAVTQVGRRSPLNWPRNVCEREIKLGM